MNHNTGLQKLRDPRIGSGRYRLWINQAEFDLKAAKESIKDGFFEWAVYQSEQAVEKALKSVILQAGFVPPKIHKLSVLIGYCNNINDTFKNTKFEFRDIDAFTFISRYPFLLPDAKLTPHEQIKADDAGRLHNQAERIFDKIKIILEGGKPEGEEYSKAYKQAETVDLDKRIESVVADLNRNFDLIKVILFGSYARNFNYSEERTMDLLIIANTDLDFLSRIVKARETTRGGSPVIEPLVYTPNEFRTLMEEEGEGFLETAVNEGKIIFEKK